MTTMEARMPVPGLTDVAAEPLERHPIRTREGATTRSAWRLAVSSAEGAGAIVFVESAPDASFYRGEGVFLGWDQERLAAAYRALLPEPAGADPEMAQLG
jgi:hypothetical protein